MIGGDVVRQEIDLELRVGMESTDGGNKMTVQRGKHRKAAITQQADLYFEYPFDSRGGVAMDLNA